MKISRGVDTAAILPGFTKDLYPVANPGCSMEDSAVMKRIRHHDCVFTGYTARISLKPGSCNTFFLSQSARVLMFLHSAYSLVYSTNTPRRPQHRGGRKAQTTEALTDLGNWAVKSAVNDHMYLGTWKISCLNLTLNENLQPAWLRHTTLYNA